MLSGFEGSSDASRCWSSPTSSVSVEVKSSISSRNLVERPRPRELEPVRHLVDRDPGPEVGRVQAPLRLEAGDVRDDEQQRARAVGPGHGDVVLPQHLLGERPQDGADLRARAAAARAAPAPARPRPATAPAIESCCAAAIASPIFAAAGSSTARSPSMFAWTHCPRRTASTFGMSEGACEAGEPGDLAARRPERPPRTRDGPPRRGRGPRCPRTPTRSRPASRAPSSPVRSRTSAPAGSHGTAGRRSRRRRAGCRTVAPRAWGSCGHPTAGPAERRPRPVPRGSGLGLDVPGPSLRWVRATRPARARHGGPDRRRRGGRVRERPRGGWHLRLPGDRARPLRRRRGDRSHVRGVGGARPSDGSRSSRRSCSSAGRCARSRSCTGSASSGSATSPSWSPARPRTVPRRSRPAATASSSSRRTCRSGRKNTSPPASRAG